MKLQARVKNLEHRKNMNKRFMTWREFLESEIDITKCRLQGTDGNWYTWEEWSKKNEDEYRELHGDKLIEPVQVEPPREANIDLITEIEQDPELKAEMLDFLSRNEDAETGDNYQREQEEERQKRIDLLRKLAKGVIINE